MTTQGDASTRIEASIVANTDEPRLEQGLVDADGREVTLADSEAFALRSEAADREYWIEVALPAGPVPVSGYAVLYVLDGNARFPLLREARETLTRGGPQGDGLPLLVVGIGYPGVARFGVDERALDYTPPTDRRAGAEARPGNGGGVTTGVSERAEGGGEAFRRFIEHTLKPALARRYPIDGSRQALLGHSYGALFTLYALQECPGCFRDYIAISPSLWWNGGQVPARFDDLQHDEAWREALEGRRLLLGVGGDEQTPRAAEEGTPRGDLRRQRAMVDNTLALATQLEQMGSGLSTSLAVFAGEDHGSVMWPAARRALAFVSDTQGQ